jgi:hypothetical protein
MCEIDLIRIARRRRGDEMKEHCLVAFVEIVVDWVQSDVHRIGASGDANERSIVYAIEPIILA